MRHILLIVILLLTRILGIGILHRCFRAPGAWHAALKKHVPGECTVILQLRYPTRAAGPQVFVPSSPALPAVLQDCGSQKLESNARAGNPTPDTVKGMTRPDAYSWFLDSFIVTFYFTIPPWFFFTSPCRHLFSWAKMNSKCKSVIFAWSSQTW